MRTLDNEVRVGTTRSNSGATGADALADSRLAKSATRSRLGGRALVTGAVLLFTAGTATALAGPAVAATKTATLQSLGKPTVTANCKGGSYRTASASSPMTTISGKKWTSGFALTGTNCNTLFSWSLKNGYSNFKAEIQLDAANSGPLLVQFRSGNTPVKFTAGGKAVYQLKVGPQGAQIQLPARGISRLVIALPNAGSDAGILDVTSNSLG
jgi:hypothetical protein